MVFLPTIDFGFGSGCNQAGDFCSLLPEYKSHICAVKSFRGESALASLCMNFICLKHFLCAGLPQYQVTLKGKVFFEGTALLTVTQGVAVTVDLHEVRALIRERLRGDKVRLTRTKKQRKRSLLI